MTFIPSAQLGAARFVSYDPETGVLAVQAADGTLQNLLVAQPDTGSVLHQTYAAGGAHVFEDSAGNEIATLSASELAAAGEVLAQGTLNVRQWANLQGKPTTFPPAAHTHAFADLTNRPTTVAGYGITDALAAAHTHDLAGTSLTGVLPPAKGGTGVAGVGAAGTVLVSDGSTAAYGAITNASVASGAGIAWSKVSKAGAAAADVGALSQDAGDARYFPLTGGYLNGNIVCMSPNVGTFLRLITQTPEYGSRMSYEDGTHTWYTGLGGLYAADGAWFVAAGGSERTVLVATANGRLGIDPQGSAPTETLDVNGNARVRGAVVFADASTQAAAAYTTTASDARYVHAGTQWPADQVSGVLAVAHGGTGQSAYQPGDVLAGGAGGALQKVSPPATSAVLRADSGSGASWGLIGNQHVAAGAAISAAKIDFTNADLTAYRVSLGGAVFDLDGALLDGARHVGTFTISGLSGSEAPFQITGTQARVENLNADLLDGREGVEYLDLGNATGALPAAAAVGSYAGITGLGTLSGLDVVGDVAVLGNTTLETLVVGSDFNAYSGAFATGIQITQQSILPPIRVPANSQTCTHLDADSVDGWHATALRDLSNTTGALDWSKVSHPTTRDGYGLEDVPTFDQLGMAGSAMVDPGNISYPGLLNTWGVLAGFSPQGTMWVNGGAAGTVLVATSGGPAFSQIGNDHVAANAAIAWSKIDRTGANLVDFGGTLSGPEALPGGGGIWFTEALLISGGEVTISSLSTYGLSISGGRIIHSTDDIPRLDATNSWLDANVFEGANSMTPLAVRVQDDADYRLQIDAWGAHRWGGGTTAADTALYRSGAGTMSMWGTLLVGAPNVANNGVGGTKANAAAALEVLSTTKGFLPPRMTATQRDAIATPPDGLIVYNTTAGKLNLREAGAWKTLTSA